jgi:serine/threonine protein kinase
MIYGNRYEETGEASAGGAGSVVICNDPNLQRRVAIKFLQPHIERRRISDEIAALQLIRSNHVVEVYDIVVHQPGNQIGIVQEYLPGDDLLDLSRRRTPTPEELLLLLYQLASGLHDIHEQGVIHRDIKPNNMKYNAEGLIKVFDFGLARGDGVDARTVGFRGTPGFAAPELYGSGTIAFTPSVDVYAFAATAIFCSNGDMPPQLASHPAPPSGEAWVSTGGFASLRVSLPPNVAKIFDGCVANDPVARPTMRQIRDCLAVHLLEGRHRALLTHNGVAHICERAKPQVNVRRGANTFTLAYDNHSFIVAAAAGDVFVNNHPVVVGGTIPGSCVVTLGGPQLGGARDFITLDVSHPEVVL